MLADIQELEASKMNRKAYPELRNQLCKFFSVSIEDFANSIIYTYLQGSAIMAMKLLHGAIGSQQSSFFISRIDIAALVSKESLQAILPVSLLPLLRRLLLMHLL